MWKWCCLTDSAGATPVSSRSKCVKYCSPCSLIPPMFSYQSCEKSSPAAAQHHPHIHYFFVVHEHLYKAMTCQLKRPLTNSRMSNKISLGSIYSSKHFIKKSTIIKENQNNKCIFKKWLFDRICCVQMVCIHKDKNVDFQSVEVFNVTLDVLQVLNMTVRFITRKVRVVFPPTTGERSTMYLLQTLLLNCICPGSQGRRK